MFSIATELTKAIAAGIYYLHLFLIRNAIATYDYKIIDIGMPTHSCRHESISSQSYFNHSKLYYLWALINLIVSEQSEDPSKRQIKIDEDSFFHLYQSYWKKLYHLAYKYIGDVYRAEGIVQEVFTSLWQRKDQILLEEATVEHYLVRAVRFRIARSYSDEARKTKKRDELLSRQTNSDHHTEEQVLYTFLRAEVDQLVSHLPERCKAVYELSRNEGLNNREIAGNLLISEKTVENQLTKALKFLRKGLRKYPGS